MEGIEKIKEKIEQDARAEISRITKQTASQVWDIRTQAQEQAEKVAADIEAKGERAAAERLERLQSAAQMERRKLELAAKQQVLNEAFDKALEKLCALPEREYIDLLVKLAIEASSTGREQLVFSKRDRARIGKQVVVTANEQMTRGVAPGLPNAIADTKMGAFLDKVVNTTTAIVTGTGNLTISERTAPIRGGFILVDGDVEVNCAFETLVRLQREKLEKEVAKVLFD